MNTRSAPPARPPAPRASKNSGNTENEGISDWRRHLPGSWLEAIDPPLYFERYSEYEMPAERAVGYDADDRPCFTAHRFVLTNMASDDDEEFYEVVCYSEEMAAWRLRDERWLVFRTITTNNCAPPRGFYAFSPDMPR